jgi:polyhydroxyalkanoate synthesis regulator phasin
MDIKGVDIMAISKDHINKLIQQLSEDDLPVAANFLENLVSKSKDKHIPWDDEPTTPEDIEDIKKAKEAFRRGDTIKFEDVIDDLLN